MTTWRLAWRLTRYQPWLFVAACATWAGFYTVPLITGFLLRAFFDALTGGTSFGLNIWTLLALVTASEALRLAVYYGAVVSWIAWWVTSQTLLRRNLLDWIVRGPGGDLPGSPGEAVSRFRDDAEDVLIFIDTWLDLGGQALFAVIALAVMATIDPLITAVIALPMGTTVIITHAIGSRLRTYRKASREATAEVTGFIGELFSAVLAVKVAVADLAVVQQFRRLSESRREAAVKDRLCVELLGATHANTVNLATGAVLLLAAGAIRSGKFTVGDLALFVSYLGSIATVPRWLGSLLARHRHAGISFDRMASVMVGAPEGALVSYEPIYLHGALPEIAVPGRSNHDRLELLTVAGLAYRYPGANRGVHDIELNIRRGSFTVITGRIGSGKTTLLRALLGLLPAQAGATCWNGTVVRDAAAFFVPPRCAYTPQAPRLFSESLADNIMMGLPADEGLLDQALALAALEQDVGLLPEGLDTPIGARGIRLSGGQAQRTAAARMFARSPELLVFDDLSSALDVETERLLWDRVFAGDSTCLVVSHRRSVLQRADHIVVLQDGAVAGEGTLDELMASCAELGRLLEERRVLV